MLQFQNGNTTSYQYGADGSKRKVTHQTAIANVVVPMGSTQPLSAGQIAYTSTTDYCGNVVYENNALSMILTEEGYITLNGTTPTYHYYLKDHLGNNRVVIDQSGTVEQVNHYYPFGGLFGEGTATTSQPYKYNGKELDRMHGLDWYDYGARMYDAALGRWHTVDPAADRYPNISPYAYCANNPIIYIDPTGMYIEEGSLKEWESRKSEVTSQRNKLQRRVDELTAKAEAKGWSAEKLASKIGNKNERIASLNASLGTMGTIESSSQGYSLSHTAPGENGGVTLNTGTNTIDIRFGSGNTANFVHEVTHAGQFETVDLAFDSKSGMTLAQDIHDEVVAYKAQYAYNPSSVSGLTSTSYANSFGAITTSWAQGLAGGNTLCSGRNCKYWHWAFKYKFYKSGFYKCLSSNPALKHYLSSFILKTSYPNIYYKK